MDHCFDGMDAKLSSLEYELLSEIDQRFRAQTWALMSVLVAMLGLMIATFGVIAAIKL